MLQVTGLTKNFGGFTAVNDVSFSVAEGEILGLLGPNGSGKSTTFNCIAGMLKPTAGSVKLAGAEIAGLTADATCRRGIGRTFQIPRPFRELSLLENATLAAHFGKLNVVNALFIDGSEVEKNFFAAARNIPNIDVLPIQGINVYDIMRRKTLVLTKAALDALEARFK